MSKLKKITSILAALCLTVGSAAFAVACGGGEEDPGVEIKIEVKDDAGNPLAGIDFDILKGVRKVATVTSDEKGKATYLLEEGATGEYTVEADRADFPTGFVPDSYVWSGEVTKDVNVEFIAENMSSSGDGTRANPFEFTADAETGTMTVTLPANKTYYYIAYRLMERNLVIENSDVEVIYNNETYAANEKGVINVPIGEGADDPRIGRIFSIANKTAEEITFVMALQTPVSEEGTQNNPYDLELDKETVASVASQESAVYYAWTATANGKLIVALSGTEGVIAITNQTTSVALEVNAENKTAELAVAAGDRVTLIVSLPALEEGEEAPTEEVKVPFTVTFEESIAE